MGGLGSGHASARLPLGSQFLSRNAARDAQSNAHGPADGSRSHTVYDSSSGSWRFALHATVSGLLSNGNRSNVERFLAATRAFTLRGHLHLEVAVTSRMRELIQQLGEAIHESVIESEQIAGVVQDIRKHGFDVLLMLEATIGLNEVIAVAKKGEADTSAAETGGETGTFTQNDLHFLRSLRISIQGEENETGTDVK
jgi:hypothetical protein